MTLAVAGIALSAVSCDGAIGKMSSDRDSLSYALGANMGLSLNLGMGDLGLNNEVVIKELKSFFKDGDVVDAAALVAAGAVKKFANGGFKVLCKGDLEKKLTVKANAFSATAKAKIEALGGTCEVIA